MLDISTDITSLSHFKKNSLEHLKSLKKTGRPEILTVNGHPEVVIQDVASYQTLLEKADYVDTVKAIRAGMAAHERGEGVPFEEAFEEIAKKLSIDWKR